MLLPQSNTQRGPEPRRGIWSVLVAGSVFRAIPSEGFEWALPVDEHDFERFRELDGTERARTWRPVKVRLLREDEGAGPFEASDTPWMTDSVLILRARALVALGPLLRQAGELLPLECDEVDLWALNVLSVIDALDEDNSKLVRFSSGRIMQVDDWHFDRASLEGASAVFKVAQLPRGPLLFTQSLVDAVEEAGLRGVGYQRVWTADP